MPGADKFTFQPDARFSGVEPDYQRADAQKERSCSEPEPVLKGIGNGREKAPFGPMGVLPVLNEPTTGLMLGRNWCKIKFQIGR